MKEYMMEMPAVVLRGAVILPEMVAHFDTGRKKSVKAIEYAMMREQKVFLITQKDMDTEEPSEGELYRIGVVARIKQVIRLRNNAIRVLAEGKERAELVYLTDQDGYQKAEIVLFDEEAGNMPDGEEAEAMARCVKEALSAYCAAIPRGGKELAKQADGADELGALMDQIINNLPVNYVKKQQLLEAVTVQERYEALMEILMTETATLRIKSNLQQKVKERIDKNQREYILREEMKVIREELGEDDTVSDADRFLEEAQSLNADKNTREKIKKEILRFKNMAPNSSEGTVMRSYIETLLDMPWNKTSRDNNDLDNAEQILNADHYGLEKVKERILEFLAVRNLTEKGDSPIICLVGPPGTGKTSIARSVAGALNKKYVRICLGGVRDEAEIRGHRRTYVGAMPGRIAGGIKNAGVKNPLMLLDEIDKMSSDYKGDTASAMLEVLDSEQNARFVDHYVEIPIDLSEVLFIATANDMQTIPGPLLDRMEMIEVSSYTENEKMHIAKEHLIGKQMKRNGIKEGQLSISDAALERMIRGYTREAGVRGLERKIGEVCRKTAREIYQNRKKQIRLTEASLEKYLGQERYTLTMANETDEVGIVRGLAWTSVGGATLQIEVNIMPGKGEFQLTGQLGDVMKESARTGISYIRSVAEKYQIQENYFRENDIHIHIPEGAVPKDGPSAGITMATAMLSAITNTPVHADVAMTGEITLRGRVLPIGGLKEKTLAAKNAGIKTVCVPKKNERDVEEISPEIRKALDIRFVETMEDVLDIALCKQERA